MDAPRRPPDAPGPRSAPPAARRASRRHRSRSSGSSTSRARPRDEVQGSGHDHRAVAGRQREVQGTVGVGDLAHGGVRERARQAAASSAAGIARGRRGPCTPRSRRRPPGRDRGDDRGDVLVGHRRPDEDGRRRRVRPAPGEVRPEVLERRARAAAPSGLCAPSSSTSRGPPAWRRRRARGGPASARSRTRAAGPPRGPGDARRLEGVEERVGDRDVRRLVPSAQGDVRRSEPGQRDRWVSRSQPSTGARPAIVSGPRPRAAPPDHGQAVAGRTRHGHVAALDDRRLLAGDRRDRRSRRSVWSRPRCQHRDAAVPWSRPAGRPARPRPAPRPARLRRNGGTSRRSGARTPSAARGAARPGRRRAARPRRVGRTSRRRSAARRRRSARGRSRGAASASRRRGSRRRAARTRPAR